MTTTPTDEELAKAVQTGNRDAAALLLTRHHDAVYGLALRLLRNPQDAAELAQDAMVKALSSIDSYDSARPFAPWLYRIARNLCIDRHRRRRPQAEFDDEATAAPDDGRRSARPADAVLHQARVDRALHEALARIGPKYREIIELYHYEHLSYREIAERLGLPDGTVMNRLFRARKKVQALLLEQGVTP